MAEISSNPASSTRYSTIAIALHWIIAIAILSVVFLGWWMEDLRHQAIAGDVSFDFVQAVFNWHKTIGISILVLSIARLAWRLTHPAPPLPETMKPWEKTVAKATHIAFYVMMIGLPLGGWATASSTNFPSKLFNIDAWLLPSLPVPKTEEFYEMISNAHAMGGWIIFLTVVLHVGAALMHHFIKRDDVLTRMIPILKTRS
jgi:cytochrome b561